ncbi:uncharacterized protein LOC105843125 [Hydra vulgaris]|uniref:uncharacterized protein LOC105843125 n=1 Tax=Hydra vulgaris TaxID=6087 RepID=UPI001F5EBE70|nr:uncharacterized protein LOC105843125 [Hydra vulgaris]
MQSFKYAVSQSFRAESDFQPVRTSPNGNCLFNACSISLIGNESLSEYLRCLTSIELYTNVGFSSNHPIIFSQTDVTKSGRIDENTAFFIIISQKAYNSFCKNNRTLSIVSESINIATNYSYSLFLTLCVLSSVVGIPIESYYPIEKDRKEIEKTAYEIFFNCTVRPRVEQAHL